MNFKLEDYMKPGISRNAKNQITYNNFVHTESKKFQIKEIENENRKKAEKKFLEIKKIADFFIYLGTVHDDEIEKNI